MSMIWYITGACYVGCLVYADDIILISASLIKLQRMMDICFHSGETLDIVFNAKKSSLFIIGKGYDDIYDDLYIGYDCVKWSHSLKYLGTSFTSGRLLVNNGDINMRKFYVAANAILSHVKYASDLSKLYLLETFCLPILSFSCEALNYNKQQLRQMNVCWNNGYRKVFHMNVWESVQQVIFFCERLDFVHIYASRKLIFLSELLRSGNDVLLTCFSVFKRSREFISLCSNFEVDLYYNEFCSRTELTAAVNSKFAALFDSCG